MFQNAGYVIKIINTINFKMSMHYNPSMYVLSNGDRLNGASALLDSKTMEDISEKLGAISLSSRRASMSVLYFL